MENGVMKMSNIKRGPRSRQQRKLNSNQVIIDQNQGDYDISWDKQAFDAAIRSQGIQVVHYRAMPDPSGLIDKGDVRAPDATRRSSDGFIFQMAGECRVFFSNNNSGPSISPTGTLDFSTAYMTLPSTYDTCNDPLIVAPYDRFFLKDIEVRVINFQRVTSNSTGIDRLQYPATCVEWLVDSRGVEYKEGTEFKISNEGHIQWLGQNRPGWDTQLGRGVIYSIRYRYTPYFVVKNIVHEIRVANVTDPMSYKRSLERMPYAIMVAREHVFQDINQDPQRPHEDIERYSKVPPVGGNLGPQ